MSDLQRPVRPFYLTMPSPCPYIEGKLEQRVVAEMREKGDAHLFDQLSEAGFSPVPALALPASLPGMHGLCVCPRSGSTLCLDASMAQSLEQEFRSDCGYIAA